jgi:hypothetical protein
MRDMTQMLCYHDKTICCQNAVVGVHREKNLPRIVQNVQPWQIFKGCAANAVFSQQK